MGVQICAGIPEEQGTEYLESALLSCLYGTAIGDALGLPYEGLRSVRAQKLLGVPDRYRLFFGKGMVSDDTEHTCLTVQAWAAASDDPQKFARELARRLRWWLAGLPAGIGRATLLSILRLWTGVAPQRSGMMSAGNGPAMRSAVLAVLISDIDSLKAFIHSSARITHSDPRAEHGALAVAAAARTALLHRESTLLNYPKELLPILPAEADEMREAVYQTIASVEAGESTQVFAGRTGSPGYVSGYVLHTVPVAIHAWLSHPHDFLTAIQTVIRCGGDADTTAAITGGIMGAGMRPDEFPADLLQNLAEWPCSVQWMRQLANKASAGRAHRQPPVLIILLRNLIFLSIVLIHGIRRTLPPWR